MSEIDLGIDLGCRQRAMAEQLLDRPQIHSRFQEVGCKSMPQRVWVEVKQVGTAAHRIGQQPPNGAITEASSALVDEEGLGIIVDASPESGPLREIGNKRRRRKAAKGHQALLAPFSAHSEGALADLYVVEIEGHQLPDPKAGAVEELNNRPVAATGRRVREGLE